MGIETVLLVGGQSSGGAAGIGRALLLVSFRFAPFFTSLQRTPDALACKNWLPAFAAATLAFFHVVSPAQWITQGPAEASNAVAANADPALALRHGAWPTMDYRVTSYRVVNGLANGSYTLRAQARSSGGQFQVFAFAKSSGFSQARTRLAQSPTPQALVIPGIPVTDGKLILGLHSDALSGQWAELADIQLTREAQPRPFLAGGDVSVLPWLERSGARYADRAGKPGDALKILADSGLSIARLRLYESPGPGHGADGHYWPKGSMDLPDLLALAKRSAALGMQIQLTLHYSDFWTNSKQQMLPAAWADELKKLPDEAARFARLRERVYQRSREVMLALQAQGTTPQFVSIGNEIEAGMLYPYGAATAANWPRLGLLLRAGIEGVKSVSPSSRVVLHLDDAGNMAKYSEWFDHARAEKVEFDVIGASYYPFWTRKTVAEVVTFSQEVTARYDRDLLIMETGFNFSPKLPNGWPGQLSDNGPYAASMSSPDGQRAFIDELFSKLKRADRVLGVLYWDPVMIETPGVGWALRESTGEADGKPGQNVVSNTTLFDFKGRALPVLDAWREHAAAMPLTPTKN